MISRIRTVQFFAVLISLLWIGAQSGFAQENALGTLVVEVLGEAGHRSEAPVYVYSEKGNTPLKTMKIGVATPVSPGTYRIELEVLGGHVSRHNVLVKTGRTTTVMIGEVAGLQIEALDKKGQDLGLTVEVYDSASGEKLGSFLSGDTILSYPGLVDVKIAVPPQSQWWRKVTLQGNAIARLRLQEQVYGELRVHPLLNGKDVSSTSQVVIYKAGTQKEVARSEPAAAHHFRLEPGKYDLLVQNASGKGKPFVMDQVEIAGEEPVEKMVPLDEPSAPTPAAVQTL